MFLCPVPENLGYIQCTIERNTSGFNKLWPKYTMVLSDDHTMMLEAKKLASSKTPHYRIELQSKNIANMEKNSEDNYLGRLRSNISSQEFYVYDKGLKSTDLKPGSKGVLRRQLGTILYVPDKIGSKGPRAVEVYLPTINTKDGSKLTSWDDTDSKKSFV